MINLPIMGQLNSSFAAAAGETYITSALPSLSAGLSPKEVQDVTADRNLTDDPEMPHNMSTIQTCGDREEDGSDFGLGNMRREGPRQSPEDFFAGSKKPEALHYPPQPTSEAGLTGYPALHPSTAYHGRMSSQGPHQGFVGMPEEVAARSAIAEMSRNLERVEVKNQQLQQALHKSLSENEHLRSGLENRDAEVAQAKRELSDARDHIFGLQSGLKELIPHEVATVGGALIDASWKFCSR
jgi:hypothetical protein